MRELRIRPARRGVIRRRQVRRSRWPNIVLLCLGGVVGLILLAMGGLYLRLSLGPVAIGKVPDVIAQSLARQVGPGWSVVTGEASLQLHDGSPALRVDDLEIRNPAGAVVARAPRAAISIALSRLFMGQLAPRAIEIDSPQFRLSLNKNGSLSLLPADTPSSEAPGAIRNAQPHPDAPTAETASRPDKKSANGPSPVSVVAEQIFNQTAGTEGILGTLEYAKLMHARLTLVDGTQFVRARFEDVDALFARTESNGRTFHAAFSGLRGQWRLSGTIEPDDDADGYSSTIQIEEAPVQDVLLLTGMSAAPFSTTMSVSGKVDVAIDSGHLQRIDGKLSSHGGIVQIHDKDTGPFDVDNAELSISWNESRRTLLVENASFVGGQTKLQLQGELQTELPDAAWRIDLRGSHGMLSGEGPQDEPVVLETIDIAATYRQAFELERFSLRGPKIDFNLTGSYGKPDDSRAFLLIGQGRESSARALLRIWPEAVAPKVRVFLADHVRDGLVKDLSLKMNYSGNDIDGAISGAGTDPQSMLLSFSIVDGRMAIGEGLPELGDIAVTGLIDGASVAVEAPTAKIDLGSGRVLHLGEGKVALASYWDKSDSVAIDFKTWGKAAALGAFLRSPAIENMAGAEFEPDQLGGVLDLNTHLTIPIKEPPTIDKMPIRIEGKITGFSLNDVWKEQDLEKADLALAYVNGDLTIKGTGLFAGAPASVDIRKMKTGGEASVSVILDDTARRTLGLPSGSMMKGPVAVKVLLPLPGGRKDSRVEIDLVKVVIDQVLPGWSKAAGRPGSIAFDLVAGDDTTILRDLIVDAGPVQIRGTAEVSDDGMLVRASLPTLKISQGDDMQAQIERVGEATKIVLRGNNADGRGLIKFLSKDDVKGGAQGGRTAATGNASGTNYEIDAALNIVTGFSGEALTGGTYKTSIRDGVIRHVNASARLGPATLSANSMQQEGATVITLKSGDAGRLLRFIDLYSHVSGGELIMNTFVRGDGAQSGYLVVSNFIVQNEPGLKRIVPTQSQTVWEQDSKGISRPKQIDINQVVFNKARAEFRKTAGRLEFQDVAIWGAELGFTLSGSIDYQKDRTDIVGTYVPAYGLNNAIANFPIFGPLLGGGKDEGLFAVNFRMSGPVSSPTLNVSPLSAVAPGFLRKVFGEIENSGRGNRGFRSDQPSDRPLSLQPPQYDR